MKHKVHKIASVVHHLNLPKEVELCTEKRPARTGDVVLVRAKAEKRFYGELELAEGRMAKIFTGDLIIGALGSRRALKGFVGNCPETLEPGAELAILNLGGVIGVPQAPTHPDLGSPCPVEHLGFVMQAGTVASAASITLPDADEDTTLPPLIAVSGTCMASGKTRAACEIIHALTAAGRRINAAKLTGVACRRDTLVMADHGARETASFLDCGLVSTVNVPEIGETSLKILRHLAAGRPDLIVFELGDGIMGEYGVLEILRTIKDHITVHVLCATDPVGAWGALHFLAGENIKLDIISGSCTDNMVGITFIEAILKRKAVNAYLSPESLGREIQQLLENAS